MRIRNGLKEIFLFYFPGSLVQEHGLFEAFMFVLTVGVKAVQKIFNESVLHGSGMT